MVKNVAIIGAGLGGLAAAIALRQRGIDAQVYEKARNLRAIGAGLSLFPNGLHTLAAIAPGLVETLHRCGSSATQVNIKKSTGALIAQNQVSLQNTYQQPMLNIRWSRLQDTLISALPADIIHLNHHCLNFIQSDHQVEVYFENGKTIHAELLIGADGIHSLIRQQLMGDGLPNYVGRLSWRAIIPFQPDWLPPNEVTILTGTDGKIFTLIDVGCGDLFWSTGALSAEAVRSPDAATIKARVAQTFAGWADPVQTIIETTADSAMIERPIWDRSPLPHWSQGRVTLLGDAAHPMVPSLGQGANTAFEDAWELAYHLTVQPAIAAALSAYDNSRIYRTQIIQLRSAFQGDRAYRPDSETFLQGVAKQAQANQAEFENWLYGYNPLSGLPSSVLSPTQLER